MSHRVVTKKCEQCGVEFEGIAARFCGETCRNIQRVQAISRRGVSAKCVACGRGFTSYRNGLRVQPRPYCTSECKRALLESGYVSNIDGSIGPPADDDLSDLAVVPDPEPTDTYEGTCGWCGRTVEYQWTVAQAHNARATRCNACNGRMFYVQVMYTQARMGMQVGKGARYARMQSASLTKI